MSSALQACRRIEMKPLITSKGVVHNPDRKLVCELLKAKRETLDLTRRQLRNPWIFEAPAGTIFMFAHYKRDGSILIATVAWYNGRNWIPMQ